MTVEELKQKLEELPNDYEVLVGVELVVSTANIVETYDETKAILIGD